MKRAPILLLTLLALAGCDRGRYELLVERTEEDVDASCETICYAAATSADTEEDLATGDPDLISCDDLDYVDGRDMVDCSFWIYR